MKYFSIKSAADQRTLLNLGCGSKMHWEWVNVDFSPYARLARYRRAAKALHTIGILSDQRLARLNSVDPDIVCWDLRKGIPFPADAFDVVYHSHVLEHVPREHALSFLRECLRVLRSDGVLRVVVPDLQLMIAHYTQAVLRLREGDEAATVEHETAISDLFDQMIREYSVGTLEQPPLVRALEKIVRGDAGNVGELHKWMYDEYSLRRLLEEANFRRIEIQSCMASGIPGWKVFGLDLDGDGNPHKRDSLYVEARK